MIGENQKYLENLIRTCSLRIEKGIRQSQVYLGEYPIFPKYLPFRIIHPCSVIDAPCGAKCNICDAFIDNNCIGCPSTKFYMKSDKDKEV